jgi:hypothetical protein
MMHLLHAADHRAAGARPGAIDDPTVGTGVTIATRPLATIKNAARLKPLANRQSPDHHPCATGRRFKL